jgi:hypothetical protein
LVEADLESATSATAGAATEISVFFSVTGLGACLA